MLPTTSISVWSLTLFSFVSYAASQSTIHWPYSTQIEYLERILYEDTRLSILTRNCSVRDSTTVAAQWIRLAYHDMSTHNVDDGTGGIDASIRFELDRAENVGVGMSRSLSEFRAITAPVAGMADIIAMAASLAYPACGGPTILYKGGRVDATAAGVSGVPEPHQDLQTHIDIFRRQGFTQTEMIQLVACGHTVGGIRKADFPTATDSDFGLFHGGQNYNNSVVTGYLDGTTPNPLVISANETLRSDLRIFASDGNATMQGISLTENLNKVCSSLVERMLNTVPNNVTLTDVIDPIKDKIGRTRLSTSSATNNLTMITSLRLLNPNSDRKVTLFYNTRDGSNTTLSAQPTDSYLIGERGGWSGGYGFSYYGMYPMKYDFNVSIDPTTSISKFWFEVEEDGETRTINNDDGNGYEVDQDKLDVMFEPFKSYSTLFNDRPANSITIAVRTDAHPSRVYIESYNPNTPGPFQPQTSVTDLPLDSNIQPKFGYTFYTGRIGEATSFNVHADVNGRTVTQEFVEATELKGTRP